MIVRNIALVIVHVVGLPVPALAGVRGGERRRGEGQDGDRDGQQRGDDPGAAHRWKRTASGRRCSLTAADRGERP